ncbi:MAG: hypothetical protein AAB213_05210, partial [Candidatus Omnitrophota bacterium]
MKTRTLSKISMKCIAVLLCAVAALVVFLPLMDAQAYQIKRAVRGTTSMGSTAEVLTLDISGALGGVGLDLSKSFLIVTFSAASNDRRDIDIRALIDDPTHILFSRRTSGIVVNIDYMVVEFASGVNVYTGVTTIAELVTSKVVTLPQSVDLTKSFPLLNWSSYNTNNSVDEANIFSARLSAANQVTITRKQGPNAYNNDISYQIVEFDRDVFVQKGTSTIAAAATTATVNLNSAPTYYPIDPAKSFLVFSKAPGANVNGDEEQYATRGEITDANTLTFTRQGTSDTVEIEWYAVEMKNEAFSKRGTQAMGVGTSSATPSLAPDSVALERSLAFISLSTTAATGTADYDEIYCRGQISAANQLTLTRNPATADIPINIAWFVTEFPLLDIATPVGSVSDTDYTGATKWSIAGNGLIEWYYSDGMKTGGLGTGGVHRIKIEVSVDGGTTWLQVPGATALDVDTGTPDNFSSWTWTNIPASISGTNLLTKYGTAPKSSVKIKISDIEAGMGTRNFDISNNYFIINPTLTLNQPPNTWKIGEQKNITWASTGDLTGKTLTIALATDGTNFDHTVASGVNATTTSYAWTIPSSTTSLKNTIGTTNILKLTYDDDPLPPQTTVVSSSTAFTLKGQIYSVSPTTAVTWLLGEVRSITWSKKGYFGAGLTDGTVDLYYSSNSGLSYDPTPIATGVAAGTDAGGGSYNWTIPNNLATSNPTSKIKVVQSNDSSVLGESTAFNMLSSVTVDAPLGGEIWRYGESKTVKWTPHGNLGTVVIKYKIGAGAWNYLTGAGPTDNLAGGSPEVQQSFTWLIGNPLGSGQQVTVRVAKNGAEDTVYDDANAPIYLKGTINITEPHLNELVQVTEPSANNTKSINWVVNGSISGTAHISLSSDNGATWPTVLTTGTVNITAGTYLWTVAEAHVNVNKAKVSLDGDTDATNGTSGQSAAFKTVNYLKLDYPNSTGLTFNVGDVVFIKWTPKPANFGTVDLRYDTNSGIGGYIGVIANAVASNNVPGGETLIGYKWTIPDVAGIVGDKVRVKVFQTGKETEVFSAGDFDFTIKGTLALTGDANGGAVTWLVGQNKSITWNVTGALGTVDILYSTDGGLNYTNTIVTGTPAGSGTGSYLWAIPSNVIASDRNTTIKLKVQTADGGTSAVSANNLTIQAQIVLIQPNGGQTLYVDNPDDGTDNYQISWTTYGQVPQVKLYYDNNSGLGADGIGGNADDYQGLIAGGAAISNLEGYSWSVPNAIGTKLRVKVASSVSSTNVYVNSASDFTIKGKIILSTPTAADTGANAWKINSATLPSSHLIQWKNCGDLGTVNIYYSDNGGTQYVLVTTATGASGNQNYSWQPPATWGTPTARNTIGVDNKIKITAASDEANVFAESANFELKGQLSITVPGGGEVYYIGGAQIPIAWEYAGELGNMDIFFSSDNGTTFGTALATIDVAYVQPYNLAVPNQPTIQGKIKLEQVSDRTYVKSVSPAPFAIKGAVNLTDPDGGETWLVSSSHSFTWSITVAI